MAAQNDADVLSALHRSSLLSDDEARQAADERAQPWLAALERRHASQTAFDQATEPLRTALTRLLRDESEAVAASSASLRATARDLLAPDPPEQEAPDTRIFTGSLGATVAPPYDYHFSAAYGPSLETARSSMDRLAGTGEYRLNTGLNNAQGSGYAGVGIHFRPVNQTGLLRVSATPTFGSSWAVTATFISAWSEGHIGIWLDRWTLDRTERATIVDQRQSLWDFASFLTGGAPSQGTNPGLPLTALVNVDSDHFYRLMVVCGGAVSGGGAIEPFFFGHAQSRITMVVPSITWELF